MAKKALITGITGQDGSYLAEFLLGKGYEVHGLVRKASTVNTYRIEHLSTDAHEPGAAMFLHYGDLLDGSQLVHLIYEVEPDEIYNLGAQSHVRVSFDLPEYTADVTGLGTTRILEAVRRSGVRTRLYQASSSEMFGNGSPLQNEDSPLCPRSPYAAAKVYGYWMTRNYREGYGLFCCNGILFNHESPRRAETFVTRKVSRAIAHIVAGKQQILFLGNLQAKRDWGYAPEYVEAMWLMLQQNEPRDYVIGTGECHTVAEFVEEAFQYAKLDWEQYVSIDPRLFRPTEADSLVADAARARKELGWNPKVRFKELVRIMVDADIRALGLEPLGDGEAFLRRRGLERFVEPAVAAEQPMSEL